MLRSGSSVTCFTNDSNSRNVAYLTKISKWSAFHSIVWPSIMFVCAFVALTFSLIALREKTERMRSDKSSDGRLERITSHDYND